VTPCGILVAMGQELLAVTMVKHMMIEHLPTQRTSSR
jgi:hypothetical protein